MQSPVQTGPAKAASVLVVEDQRLVAADIAMQLRQLGYRVVGLATSGRDAIEKARELRPDLVLMDIHLEGEMDGTEAARRIREHDQPAILFLTAYSDLETLERAKLAEPGGYVVKPASPVELRCALEIALHKQQSERRRAEDEARTFTQELTQVRGQVVQLEHAYQELEAYGTSLTHDLRNPLQVIAGAAEMLERTQAEQLTPLGRTFLGQVGEAADRMLERIGSLLELSRAHRAPLSPGEFDLGELAAEVYGELAVGAPGDRGTGQHDEFTAQRGLLVTADRALLRRVLENLLSNALKFRRDDAPLKIAFGARSEGDERLYYVRDNGIGFAMSSAAKLFTPYGRLPGASSAVPGTGLGLSGARRIIERHGGRIWAEAVEQAGATFYFTLGKPPH